MTNNLLGCRSLFADGLLPKADFIAAMHRQHSILFDYAAMLEECELAAIEITAGQVVAVSRDGVKFVVDPSDRRSPPMEALNFGRYEGDDADQFRALLEPGQTILDVGGHIGWYALHAAAQFPDSKVHAVEPMPESYAQLQRNAALNDLDNVTLHAMALGEHDDEVIFFFDPEYPTAASSANLMPADTVRRVTVPMRRMDGLGLAPDVIKIDVEGGELGVLRGGVETLTAHRPAVFCEMLRKWSAAHGHHPDETIRLMCELGYVCTTAGRAVERMTDDESATNFVFLHRDRHVDRLKDCS